jgi:hypothetical protein
MLDIDVRYALACREIYPQITQIRSEKINCLSGSDLRNLLMDLSTS